MSIREQFNFYDGATVPVMTKLLDCMVKSIAIYGCELWGLYVGRKTMSKVLKAIFYQKITNLKKGMVNFANKHFA